jgi:tetratricopeptide (TPR) repeat protein
MPLETRVKIGMTTLDDNGTMGGTKLVAKSQPPAFAAQFAQTCQLYDAGRFAAAEAPCRQMLAAAPDHPQVILILGGILSALGRYDEAVTILHALTKSRPNAASVHFCLGNVYHAANSLPEATRSLRRATELQPRYAAAYCNLGLVLEQMADGDGAIQAYERAILLQPALAEAHANLGRALLNAGKLDEALLQLRQAVAFKPREAKNHLLLGTALQRAGAYAEAIECHRAAIRCKPDFAEAYSCLAEALMSQEQVAEAVPHFRMVVELRPDFAMSWVALGGALSSFGRFPEAIGCFERAIALAPNLGAAHRALATSRAWIGDATELDRLRHITTNTDIAAKDRGTAGLALAKILDDAACYDDAFAAAVEGNRLLREDQHANGIVYDHAAFRKSNDETIRVFTREFLAARTDWGNPSDLPVFVLGCFRSGTTLVEQICASHTETFGAGELPDIPQLWLDLNRELPKASDWVLSLFRAHANRHLARLQELGKGSRRVIDKMPDNVFMLGLIATLFPNSRVIVCHRDGRDTALSVFFQRFARRVHFSTDLIDAGRRWHEAERMASHWTKTLPLAIHHVRYETLVADFEVEARKLIQFLGLAWQPGCLEFHKTERSVLTASAWQVRQPLFSSSVGRWLHYRAYLGSLCAAIAIAPDAPTGARPDDIDYADFCRY